MSIIEWRWSNGGEYLKSARRRKEQIVEETQELKSQIMEEDVISQTAIYQSLNGFDTTFSRNENSSGNRREYLDNKILPLSYLENEDLVQLKVKENKIIKIFINLKYEFVSDSSEDEFIN